MGDDPSQIDPDFGLSLAVLRVGRGWSQADLARASGVPASSISQYESGKKLPELASLMRILSAMDYGFSDLDRARMFLLESHLRRGSAEAWPKVEAGTCGHSGSLAQQIASMASEAGAAVSRLMEAIALLIRHHPCADPERGHGDAIGATPPSPEDRTKAVDLWRRLQSYPAPVQEALVHETREFQNWALCEHLCLESEKRAASDTTMAVQLGKLAVQVAELVPGEEPWRSRIRGYALAFLANAFRVQGDLQRAEKTFCRSDELWEAGAACTVTLLEESRLLGLKASLYRSQRRLAESLDILDRALEADRNGTLTGYLLLKRAKTLEEMGDLEAALAALEQAEAFVNEEQEPKLLAWLQHNRADYLSKLGRYADAMPLLPSVRSAYSRLGDELNMIRLRWVEGRIADGLGRTGRAIEILNQVRGDFASRDMNYDTALVSLELATIFAREGRADSVKALARHMAPIFQAQGVHREALAALALFRQAAESEEVTADLARRFLEYLYRARQDPKLRFEAQ
jgi:tetratricopeptide (TPR) repeat protein/transcriptional regulator with XRE-family HTH domain